MVHFACDWCSAIKRPGEVWILGLAAESIGVTAARREINILTGWDDTRACHPLAVHFCSVEHKDNYMAALFETEPLPATTVIEQTTTVSPNRTSERRYMRTASSGVVSTTKKKKKTVTTKRRRAA
jgi:hypothetical protein